MHMGEFPRMKPGQLQRRTPLRRKKGFWNPNTVRAKPEAVDGIQFDSGAEAREYRMLKVMQQSGQIHGLVCHPKVVLIAGDAKRGLPELAYRPDFSFYEAGRLVYQDSKNRGIEGNGAYTPREHIIFKLWIHFMSVPLRITAWKRDRMVTSRIVMGLSEAKKDDLFG